MKRRGEFYIVSAYLLWGFLPIYWKVIKSINAPQIICHRIFWSFLLLFSVLFFIKKNRNFRKIFSRKNILIYAAGSLILASNWTIYVWAVNSNLIVETSLGYFINPLLNVLMGVILLKEKLKSMQWLAIGLAATGVLYLTFIYGSFPWISLVLAFSFGLYGLIHKLGPLEAIEGLFLETGLLFVPVTALLMLFEARGTGAMGHVNFTQTFFLVFTGAATAVPLVLFNAGLRLIPLSVTGILQYIAPSLQFLVGVVIYKEPFTWSRFTGFVFVWTALIIFTTCSIREYRKSNNHKPPLKK